MCCFMSPVCTTRLLLLVALPRLLACQTELVVALRRVLLVLLLLLLLLLLGWQRRLAMGLHGSPAVAPPNVS